MGKGPNKRRNNKKVGVSRDFRIASKLHPLSTIITGAAMAVSSFVELFNSLNASVTARKEVAAFVSSQFLHLSTMFLDRAEALEREEKEANGQSGSTTQEVPTNSEIPGGIEL